MLATMAKRSVVLQTIQTLLLAVLALDESCPTTYSNLSHVSVQSERKDGPFTSSTADTTVLPHLKQGTPHASYGPASSCDFDNVIVVGGPLSMSASDTFYTRGVEIKRSMEIFLDWLHYDHGGVKLGDKRYGMRFQWVDDGSSQLQVSNASAHAVRGSNADFAWGGYSSDLTKWVAMQNEDNKMLTMAGGAAVEGIYKDTEYIFGALPPSDTYHLSSVDGLRDSCLAYNLTDCKFGFIEVDSDSGIAQCRGAFEHVRDKEGRGKGFGGVTYFTSIQRIPKTPTLEDTIAALENLRNAKVNILIGCTFTATGIAIIEALEEMDYNLYGVALSSTVDTPVYQSKLFEPGGWKFEYALGTVPWHYTEPRRGTFSNWTSAEFYQRYAKRYGNGDGSGDGASVSYIGAANFAAGVALVSAIEKAGTVDSKRVAETLETLEIDEFYSLDFNGTHQNRVRTSLVQYKPEEVEDAYVRGPDGNDNTMLFPIPPWKQRACRARFRRGVDDGNSGAGGGAGGGSAAAAGVSESATNDADNNDGATAAAAAPPLSSTECFGHGSCNTAGACECNPGFEGADCAESVPAGLDPGAVAGLVVGLLLLMVAGSAGIRYYMKRKYKKKGRKERMKLMDKAQKDMSTALQAQKHQLEDAMQEMSWPEEWDLDVDGHPSAGLLVPVPPTSDEYWQVFERLRAPSDPSHQTPGSNKGGLNDVCEIRMPLPTKNLLKEAWLSSVSRIQNTALYTYYHFQRDRMLMSMSGVEQARVNGGDWRENSDPSERVVWHGTGNFDAANIYEDQQDGFMMQFARKGQWGRGLYFAMEPGYSDFYATKASPDTELEADEKELLMATLVMGSCIELDRDCCKSNRPGGGRGNDGRNRNHDHNRNQPNQCCAEMDSFCREIIAPPAKEACRNIVQRHPVDGVDVCTAVPQGSVNAGAKYNTVRGYTQTDIKIPASDASGAGASSGWMKNPGCPVSQVFIVYENGRAYPRYIVRYYRGNRDPARTPYTSREEARAATVGGVVVETALSACVLGPADVPAPGPASTPAPSSAPAVPAVSASSVVFTTPAAVPPPALAPPLVQARVPPAVVPRVHAAPARTPPPLASAQVQLASPSDPNTHVLYGDDQDQSALLIVI